MRDRIEALIVERAQELARLDGVPIALPYLYAATSQLNSLSRQVLDRLVVRRARAVLGEPVQPEGAPSADGDAEYASWLADAPPSPQASESGARSDGGARVGSPNPAPPAPAETA